MSDDRTVHARGLAVELVRYDRSGKWYLEVRDDPQGFRRHVGIGEAVRYGRSEGVDVFLGLPGGKVFDRGVTT